MPKTKLFSKIYDGIIDFSQKEDIGHLLNITGTIGWAASSAAFTGAVALNNNIPKEQKKFLIPQEIADGVINCTLFWGATKVANDWAKKLIRKGAILPKHLDKIEEGAEKRVKDIRNSFVKDDTFMTQADKGEKSVIKEIIKQVGGEKSAVGSKLKGFSKSFPALVSVGGSVIAANIITPFVRNYVASKIQTKHIRKTNPEYNPKINVRKHFAKGLPMDQYLVNSRGGGIKI